MRCHVSLFLILPVQYRRKNPDLHPFSSRPVLGFYSDDNVMKSFLYRNAASDTMFFVFASSARIYRFFRVPTLEHAT